MSHCSTLQLLLQLLSLSLTHTPSLSLLDPLSSPIKASAIARTGVSLWFALRATLSLLLLLQQHLCCAWLFMFLFFFIVLFFVFFLPPLHCFPFVQRRFLVVTPLPRVQPHFSNILSIANPVSCHLPDSAAGETTLTLTPFSQGIDARYNTLRQCLCWSAKKLLRNLCGNRQCSLMLCLAKLKTQINERNHNEKGSHNANGNVKRGDNNDYNDKAKDKDND